MSCFSTVHSAFSPLLVSSCVTQHFVIGVRVCLYVNRLIYYGGLLTFKMIYLAMIFGKVWVQIDPFYNVKLCF